MKQNVQDGCMVGRGLAGSVGSALHPAISLYAPSGGRKYVNPRERLRALSAMEDLERTKGLFALTLAWTGARISEVLALTPFSFQIDSCLVAIRTLKRRKFIMREVPIPPVLMRALDEVFGLRRAQMVSAKADGRLWSFSRSTGWRIIKQVMEAAQVFGAAACPKGLRHGFGIAAVNAGIPVTFVQRWLGHARLTTTSIYVDATGEEEIGIAKRLWDMADDRQAKASLRGDEGSVASVGDMKVMRVASVELTEAQREAQRAVLEEPEVQEIARRLAKWGLGITMPHMHTREQDFADLPDDVVQVEQAGVVSFQPRADAEAAGLVPVGWRWMQDGVATAAGCSPFMYCNPNVAGHAFVQGHTNY